MRRNRPFSISFLCDLVGNEVRSCYLKVHMCKSVFVCVLTKEKKNCSKQKKKKYIYLFESVLNINPTKGNKK